ncbi:hypothetical protein Tco_0308175 [Tanacetum coccineum]
MGQTMSYQYGGMHTNIGDIIKSQGANDGNEEFLSVNIKGHAQKLKKIGVRDDEGGIRQQRQLDVAIFKCLSLISVPQFGCRSLPIYHMSLFKVPAKVLLNMESIGCHFFNGIEHNGKKPICVKWNKVLASKEKEVLEFSRFYAP